MDRLSARRLGFAVLGGLAAVCALTIIAAIADDAGLVRFYNMGALEWVAPLVAGASVGVVAWIVLRALPDERAAHTYTEGACPACGRAVLDDWRLCPHCGTLMKSTPAGDASKHSVQQ